MSYRPLEARVLRWIETRLGTPNVHPRERAMRLLEEAVELAQAEGITQGMVARQVRYVYHRPPGDPIKEAGGVAVCLLGWCGARGLRMMDVTRRELERIEAKSSDEIRGSLTRKADGDLVIAIPPTMSKAEARMKALEILATGRIPEGQ